MDSAKIFICSGKRSGKDYLAGFLEHTVGLTHRSSSMFAIENFLMDSLKGEFGYQTPQEAYDNRQSPEMRTWLYNTICEYNRDDKTRLACELFGKYDCYVGIRSCEELEACKERWPYSTVIWVDAEGRVPSESSVTCNVRKCQADIIVENKGTLDEFNCKLRGLGSLLISMKLRSRIETIDWIDRITYDTQNPNWRLNK